MTTKFNFSLFFVYLIWLIDIILSIVAIFVCPMPLFWKIVVGFLGCFNFVGFMLNIKMIISSLKTPVEETEVK